ncbi:MAG: penicillin acylase family protein [Acidobacteriota bacterium]
MPLPRALRRLLIALVALVLVAAAAGAGGALWLRSRLLASLPATDGTLAVRGPAAPIAIDRDARGRVTVRARSRSDLAFGLGFVHGQERFFQMDLSRRRAAGELAALFGPALLPSDRAAAPHRFRERARREVGRLAPEVREALERYAAGVNAGLAALGDVPPSYVLLRTEPAAWRAEDTLLVVDAMYLLLQDTTCRFDRTRDALARHLGPEIAALFAPDGTPWDAPLQGAPRPAPTVPGPEVLDLRARDPTPVTGEPTAAAAPPPGSNGFAVAGPRADAGGAALLANDMHLPLGVPATWLYASLVLEDDAGRPLRTVTGVTLPGAPAIVAGSNGDIAWGFTNSYADTCDVVLVEPDPDAPDRRYLAPGGPRPFVERQMTLEVAGGAPVETSWRETIWGPVHEPSADAAPFVALWVADLDGATNPAIFDLFDARTLEQAFAVAHRAGMPAQNLQVATRDGRIGWTIAGILPRRVGFDGSRPVSFADGSRRWDGLLPAAKVPRIVDPADGLVVTANARVVDGSDLAILGDAGYALGARARQIRDGLAGRDGLTPADLLAVQLDDRALFLARWQRLLLEVLERHAGGDPLRGEMRALVASWGARAAVDSAGYRIVRAFRDAVHELVLAPFAAALDERGADVSWGVLRQREAGVWALVTARPVHLLDPRFDTWDALLVAAADRVAAGLTAGGRTLAGRTWGERNTCRPRHPLSAVLPGPLAARLDMPPRRLPGDAYMPRVQGPGFGASERFAVAPGREREGFFHMPCGTSGHPLSPWYRSEHDDWAAGRFVPFLPGDAVHHLVLAPAAAEASP